MNRPSFGFGQSAVTASDSTPTNTQGSDAIQKHKELSEIHEQLKEKRRKWEYDLTQAQKEEALCLQEAQAFGVSSPEELEKLLNEQRQADQAAQVKFEADLQSEIELQKKIEQDLASLDQR